MTVLKVQRNRIQSRSNTVRAAILAALELQLTAEEKR